MAEFYDLVVIGTGTAGASVASRCRDAGWRVVIIDNRPFGGTCALRGCEPKKTLWTLAEAADRVKHLHPHGLRAEGAGIDWPAAIAFKRSFTDPVPARRARELADAGIEAYAGTARFAGANRIEIADGASAGRLLEARAILIATGARPAPLGIPGEDLLKSSDDFLDLDRLPRRLLLIGGGYISFEFATTALRAGAHPVILHDDEEPLGHFDADHVGQAIAALREAGGEIVLSAKAARLVADGDGVTVETADGRRFQGGMAVHGSGRVPNLDALALEAGNVAREGKGLALEACLRSRSNPAVWAAGDCAQKGPPLTPVATHDAEIVARNLLENAAHEPDYTGVPSVVFTLPPLASVGLTQAQADEKHVAYTLHQGSMAEYATVKRRGEHTAAYKILIGEPQGGNRDAKTPRGRIVGAHLIGPGSPEVINLFALAMRLGLDAGDLNRLFSAYPSDGSNLTSMLK